jgi:tetratricopeptide (TPR) repeat protein/tRNA A-37 threonylcarbamoyl transferase component Bud32
VLGDQLIGTRIGNFLLTDVLSRDETSVLFRGTHPELGRQVAIKVLSTQLSCEVEDKTRFLDEARILARIQHPNVIGVLDFGKTTFGELYYAMELLQGSTLDQLLRRGTMTPDQLWPYLEQICEGLGALHARGVVHRDLRPANVFIVEAKRLTLKLIDIGIAKIGEAAEPATAASDLYALGALISAALDKPLPARVAALVHRCLSAAPEDRPGSAEELAQTYEAALEGRDPPAPAARPVTMPVPEPPPARALPVAPPASRPSPVPDAPPPPATRDLAVPDAPPLPFGRPKTVPGVGLVGAAEGPIKRQRSEPVTEWSVGGDDGVEEEAPPAEVAVSVPMPVPVPVPAAGRDRRLSPPPVARPILVGPPSDLLSAFADVSDPDVEPPEPASRTAPAPAPARPPDLALQAAVEALEQPSVEAAEPPPEEASAEEPRSLEQMQDVLVPTRRMARWLKQAITVGAVVLVVAAVLIAFLVLRPGRKQSDRAPAEERRQTVELAALPPATGLDAASAETLRLAEANLASGQPQAAAAQLQRLLAAAGKSGRVHFRLAEARLVLGKLDEAIDEYRQAFAAEPRLAAAAHDKIGEVFLLKQNSGQAFAEYRAAVTADESYAPAHVSLGYTHAKIGSFDEALKELDRAVSLDPKNARAQLYRGTVLSNLGRPADAIAAYRSAVALRPGLVEARYQLGLALSEAGQAEAATEELEAALHLDPDYSPAHIALGKLRQGK